MNEHDLCHPVRGRINSWFFRLLDGYMHARLGPEKRALFADLPSTVVEIGPGTGANLKYLSRGTRVVAFEPNPYMHRALEREGGLHGIEIDLRREGAERMDLPDASVDAVISTLVLCTVPDVGATLAEIRRVLRPGGRFLCIEHVAARPRTFLRWLQSVVARPWRWFFEGCHTARDLESAIRAAGFGSVEIDRGELSTIFLPVRPRIRVCAVR